MDFRSQVLSPDSLSKATTDALMLIVGPDKPERGLDPVLAALLSDALAANDFEAKAGRTLYLHKPAQVKARRVLLVAAPATGAKAFRAAAFAGIAQLKSLGTAHIAVALAGGGPLTAEHAEALVTATHDAVYTYRQTKPSAQKAPALAEVTLLCGKAQSNAVQRGLLRGRAIAAGVMLARECANRPGNHCTPTYLADQARKLGREFALKVEVLDRKAIEKLGMGSFLAVARGSTSRRASS
jgi:leucyl aminopeptidase